MNAILKAVAMAKRNSAGPKIRDAEARYHMARQAFGIDSAETTAAWSYWHALRREVREQNIAQAS